MAGNEGIEFVADEEQRKTRRPAQVISAAPSPPKAVPSSDSAFDENAATLMTVKDGPRCLRRSGPDKGALRSIEHLCLCWAHFLSGSTSGVASISTASLPRTFVTISPARVASLSSDEGVLHSHDFVQFTPSLPPMQGHRETCPQPRGPGPSFPVNILAAINNVALAISLEALKHSA